MALVFVSLLVSSTGSHAQIPIIDAAKAAIKKVIKAIDLKIQRQQNKVIWLQNAQKTLENAMSKARLEDISDWTQKQRDIYKNYFEELSKVKTVIGYYQKIRSITQQQIRLVEAYNRAWNLLRKDKHFTVKEIEYMGKVYAGILGETVKNVDQMLMVANSFKTQMTDAKRMEIIASAEQKTQQNYTDLLIFNNQNALLSLKRAKSEHEINVVKAMYGIK
ncbi:conjugal transfer protein TraI [Pedobacter sp. ISL-68]|nr:conjugal transfer protein TraI [Pedobacter sp. ISL-64]MBT2590687.1 conjugal transfer protein TraI [Pedobacter sp. ISL-68]